MIGFEEDFERGGGGGVAVVVHLKTQEFMSGFLMGLARDPRLKWQKRRLGAYPIGAFGMSVM